jgi:hypothetical protein
MGRGLAPLQISSVAKQGLGDSSLSPETPVLAVVACGWEGVGDTWDLLRLKGLNILTCSPGELC